MADIFDGLFGRDDRTDPERAADDLRELSERNSRAEAAFEKERDRRADYLHMDQRVRNIATREINKVVNGLITLGIGYAAWREYGFAGAAAVGVVAWLIAWWQGREDRKRPAYMIEEVDELAEDSVVQQRIVDYERDGRSWLRIDGQYLNWDGLFDHPFWDDVNKRVRTYAGMTHAKRVADNATVRAASYPYRLAMRDRLKQDDSDWELPHWARLTPEERKTG